MVITHYKGQWERSNGWPLLPYTQDKTSQLLFSSTARMAVPLTDPRQRALRVLSDVGLVHHICSLQAGLPIDLYQFWVLHDAPTALKQWPLSWKISHLGSLVVAKGTLRLLDMYTRVVYFEKHTRRRGKSTYTQRTPKLDWVAREAIMNNRADVLQWTFDHNTPCDRTPERLWDYALSWPRGDTRVRDTLDANVPIALADFPPYTFAYGILDTEGFAWLLAKFPGIQLPPVALEKAAERGDLAVVRFLLENEMTECRERAFEYARYGMSGGYMPYGSSCYGGDTSHYGDPRNVDHFAVLAYLFDNCPGSMYESTAEYLIAYDKPEMVALVAKHIERIQCLREPWIRHCESVAQSGRLSDLQAWHELGMILVPISIDTVSDLAVVKFLHEHGLARATATAMDSAASRGDLALVQFLHENRTDGCAEVAIDGAIANGHDVVVKYLCEICTRGDATKEEIEDTKAVPNSS
ncbi:hypothetical protein Poli38472_007607 [Pythium oligandrum]|uniref:Ankyrin repeat protein n=1 Tax=Pythium oligandrum TaxID=41045 RepID=A0A8K1FL77_PYTOL|nr:hypothetical protein Poli38472_007607 [Pythium oligandrum]|eukprot:TMW67935.1 hypothetical protein Poli38472_007607 [Pythium oligandrum]